MPRARPTQSCPPQEGWTGGLGLSEAPAGMQLVCGTIRSDHHTCCPPHHHHTHAQLLCVCARARVCPCVCVRVLVSVSEAFARCSRSVRLTAMLLTTDGSLLTCCSWSAHLTAMHTTDARLVASSTSRLLKSTVPSRSYRSLLLMSCRQPMHLPPRSSSMMGTQRMERVRYPLLRSHCRYTYSGWG